MYARERQARKRPWPVNLPAYKAEWVIWPEMTRMPNLPKWFKVGSYNYRFKLESFRYCAVALAFFFPLLVGSLIPTIGTVAASARSHEPHSLPSSNTCLNPTRCVTQDRSVANPAAVVRT